MDILKNLLEITLKNDDDFLKIRETLTRVGVASKKDKTIYQSCHILHKQGRYYLVHFKELFALDGKPFNFTEDDKLRRNTIALLLEEWALFTIVNKAAIEDKMPISQIKVISFKDKKNWTLQSKYTVGKKR